MSDLSATQCACGGCGCGAEMDFLAEVHVDATVAL